jgi:hypothetical protein
MDLAHATTKLFRKPLEDILIQRNLDIPVVMEIPQAQRKLREAKFFLKHLLRVSDKEERFHFYLSAFLSAARSVDYVLRNEQGKDYEDWFKKWETCQSTEDRELMKSLIEKRGSEVHAIGADHFIEEQAIPVYDVYEDESGRIEVFGPPVKCMSDPPATVSKHKRFFHLSGQSEEVTAVCTSYINILKKLVRDFCEIRKAE